MLRTITTDFLADETGTITVDWAVLTAAASGMAVAAAFLLNTGTIAFQDRLQTTLLEEVTEVEETRLDVAIAAAHEAQGSDELTFAGVSSLTSTISSRVQCGTFSSGCGGSSETTSQRFQMTDGSIWTRETTIYGNGNATAETWYDGQGRETSEVPELPSDLPVLSSLN